MGRDFNFSHQTLIFNQLNTEFTVQVIILDDALAEQTEMFFLNTSLVDSALIGHVLLRPDEASVMVIDYDGKDCQSFTLCIVHSYTENTTLSTQRLAYLDINSHSSIQIVA